MKGTFFLSFGHHRMNMNQHMTELFNPILDGGGAN